MVTIHFISSCRPPAPCSTRLRLVYSSAIIYSALKYMQLVYTVVYNPSGLVSTMPSYVPPRLHTTCQLPSTLISAPRSPLLLHCRSSGPLFTAYAMSSFCVCYCTLSFSPSFRIMCHLPPPVSSTGAVAVPSGIISLPVVDCLRLQASRKSVRGGRMST
jgi:hypothetical protein